MTKISKGERRIFRDDILPCSCGNTEVYVAWRFLHGVANKKTYTVICEQCKPPYQWRKTADRAVFAWNDSQMLTDSEIADKGKG